jgi:bifunctional non-homologous end joining protein LigD
MSQGVVGDGRAYFDQACKQGLEGMVAKRLNSPYLPGKRTDAWVKVKRCEVLCCVVIGFTPDEDGRRDFAALIIATQTADGLVACVGKVGSGFDQAVRDRINSYLWSHLRKTPVIPAPIKNGIWVEPGLFCQVRCMERTTTGQLRAPAFLGIIGGGDG